MNDFKKGDFRRRQARLRAKHDKTPQTSSTNTCRMRTDSVEHTSNQHQLAGQQNTSYFDSTVYGHQHQHPSQLYNQFNSILVNPNDSTTNYSNLQSYSNGLHHSTTAGHISPYHHHHHHHHTSPNQQYNYVAFPWLPAAAAAAAATSTNSLLETITSSALACSYNTILQPHSYATSTDLCADNSNLYCHHNFHSK